MLLERDRHMQRINAEALVLWEVVVVPRGWSVEWGAGVRVGAGHGWVLTAQSSTCSAGLRSC